MCGISGIINNNNCIVDELYQSLFFLQHRGQHSSGFLFFSTKTKKTYKSKKIGLISEHLLELNKFSGNMGLGHVRYPTNGLNSRNEIQPFSILKPYGISLVHNGNITNKEEIIEFLNIHKMYINGTSDSELILNLFYFYVKKEFILLTNENIISTIYQIYNICKGSFSIIIMISDYGMIAFRDKYGIRPLCYSVSENQVSFASESNALINNNFYDVKNGEIIIVNTKCELSKTQCFNEPIKPCIFEYIYFANPDSYINNILVHTFREKVGEKILENIDKEILLSIDIVVPIPLTSIISAAKIANIINKPLKYAIVKNRYTHRTFINQGDEILKSIKKIKVIHELVENKNILVIDDSIVRGNTCFHIIKKLRKANPKGIYFASCSPPIYYPNCYGIFIPSKEELIAHNKTEKQIKNERTNK